MTATAATADRQPARILVVDDERSMRELLAIVLRREGYEVLLAENGRAAIDTLEREPVDLLISDIKMPDISGVEVLRAAKQIDRDILGIMITAFATTETAVEAMRLGACDYLSKPFDIDLLKMKVREKIENRQLRQENVLLKRTLGLSHQFSNIIGRSEPMLAVFKMIETVARTTSTILLTGESGTGKGLVAQAIHFHSLRRERSPSWRSTAARCRRTCSSPSCSATCAELVHRRGREQEGPHRGGRKRNRVPRRDRRDERGHAGQAPAGPAGAALPPRRRAGGDPGRHPRHRRHQPGPDATGGRGPVPRGSVLPDQRDPDRVAVPARPPRRHPAARRALPQEIREQMEKTITGVSARGDGAARPARLAGQYPRARKRAGAGRGPRGDADDSCREPSAGGPRTSRRAWGCSPSNPCLGPDSTWKPTSRRSRSASSPRRSSARAACRSRPRSSLA